MRRASLVVASLTLLLIGGQRIADANKTHETSLTGAAEIGGGDPDGSGTALIGLSPGGNEICFHLTVSGIASATAAHIHRGVAGVNGPVVVTLQAPSDGQSVGCVSVDPALLKEILQHPDDFYVNVHNVDYPGGAIRGQLSR